MATTTTKMPFFENPKLLARLRKAREEQRTITWFIDQVGGDEKLEKDMGTCPTNPSARRRWEKKWDKLSKHPFYSSGGFALRSTIAEREELEKKFGLDWWGSNGVEGADEDDEEEGQVFILTTEDKREFTKQWNALKKFKVEDY